ncbi:MAG TPA: SDR family oxidoreductase [Thermoplasmata archaeon]|jgi:3-oxoacyl-[acyl-carrier protein] reductase|nr:SDR family oxidoreductase [Thermoplasmata archaeon]
MRLAGKVALVVGGSGGMGAATSLALAREGAKVAVHYARSKDAALAVVRRIEDAKGTAVAIAADVSKKADGERLVRETIEQLGGLDALVVYAGHPFKPEEWFAPYEDLPEAAFRKTLDIDLLGTVFVTQAVVPRFKMQRSGKIVLVGSTPPITGDVVGFSYLVAKAGILALTRGLAQYLGPYNVHVNALAPGTVATAPMDALSPEERRRLVEEAALKRVGTAEEIANKAVFLCSPESDYMTGQTLIVDGGYAMR